MHYFFLFIFINLSFGEVTKGFTLFSSNYDNEESFNINYTTYLINEENTIINQWFHDCPVASMPYLMKDSTLVYPCQQEFPIFDIAASGGRIIKYDWNGNILWDWTCTEDYQLHHDIHITNNGTILAIASEEITNNYFPNGLISDIIIEIEPLEENDAQIIWTWKVSNHLSESFNPNKFYIYANEISQINIRDWNHFNSISLTENNEVLLSSRNWNEIYLIDYRNNGDILYRWGNPQMYGRGSEKDKKLFAPHYASIINNINENYGILLFNNLAYKENNEVIDQSSIIEFLLPEKLSNNYYFISEYDAFSPQNIIWEYKDNFFSRYQSGAQRLSNGNTLISVAEQNKIFEIDINNNIVWDSNNITNNNIIINKVLRAIKYELDYFIISGDINQDSVINILDIVIISDIILNNLEFNYIADINGDQTNNILDIMQMINIILSNNN